MNPILKGQPNTGIGYDFEEFVTSFFDICYDHLRNRRAKAFAFILFDFDHGDVFHTITDRSVFTKLDQLSGRELTIFYLDSQDRRLIEQFNQIFGNALADDKPIKLPSVIFFKVVGNDAEGLEFHRITNNKLFVFQEIQDAVKGYLGRLNKNGDKRTNFLTAIIKKMGEAGFDYLADKLLDKITGK